MTSPKGLSSESIKKAKTLKLTNDIMVYNSFATLFAKNSHCVSYTKRL